MLVIDRTVRFLSNIIHYWNHQFLWSEDLDIDPRVAIGFSESLENNLDNHYTFNSYMKQSEWPAVTWVDLDLLRWQGSDFAGGRNRVAFLGQEWASPVNSSHITNSRIRAIVWANNKIIDDMK